MRTRLALLLMRVAFRVSPLVALEFAYQVLERRRAMQADLDEQVRAWFV